MSIAVEPEVVERLKEQHPNIILKALLDGREWTHGDYTYVMLEDFELCVVAHDQNNAPIYLRTDITLKNFITMAFETGINQTAIMSANAALSKKPKLVDNDTSDT